VLLQAEAEFKQGNSQIPSAAHARKAKPGISPTNTFIGLAKRSFKTGIFPRRRKPCSLPRDFPNHRCGCGPWWKRRPRARG